MSATLAEWVRWLDGLDSRLVGLYEDWLPRLRAAFGPWRRPAVRDPDGDPDGYGGLARRGRWEQLLVTEWALAEAVPDEFVRRAAMREQLFLKLERQLPAAAPVTRVWLDCGPTQLGAPRLAHLAILLVLKRRAEEAGGTMLWAPLHDPEPLYPELDPLHFLSRRTTALVERFVPPGSDEAFVVAADPVSGAKSAVCVREGEGVLRVETPGGAVDLVLPDMAEVARALSSPVARAAPRLVQTRSGTEVEALQWAPSGGALVERRGDHLLAYAVPRGARKRVKVRWADPWYGEARPLLAAGWKYQSLCTLRQTEDGREWELKARDLSIRTPVHRDFVPPARDGRVPGLALLPGRHLKGSRHGGRSRTVALVRDGADQMWFVDFQGREARVLGRTLTDPIVAQGTYGWVRPDGGIVRLRPSVKLGAPPDCMADHGYEEVPGLVGAPTELLQTPRDDRADAIAARIGGSWWLGQVGGWGPGFYEAARFDTQHRVVGGVLSTTAHPSCLVEVVENEVWRRTTRGREPILALDSPIVTAAVGGRDAAPLVALGTASGWVHVVPVWQASMPWLSFVASEVKP